MTPGGHLRDEAATQPGMHEPDGPGSAGQLLTLPPALHGPSRPRPPRAEPRLTGTDMEPNVYGTQPIVHKNSLRGHRFWKVLWAGK